MRILQIGKYLPPVPGGIETVMYELSQGLSRVKDVKVRCLVANTSPTTVREHIGALEIVRAARWGTLASTPITPTFKTEGARLDSDLLHFHLPNPMATFAFAHTRAPYVVTYHCDVVRYPVLLELYKPALRKFLGRAEKIIVSSNHLIKSSPILPEFERKCAVIPFGIDPAPLMPDPARLSLRQKLINKFGGRIVLFVGRLVKYKGLKDLITAMEKVDGTLVVVGTGPEKEALESLTRRKNLVSKVHFAGYVPAGELGAYYEAAKVMALTSLNESEAFGMCLLDALACGLPLVTTSIPTGVQTVNVDRETGLHVPVGDTGAIAGALNRLLADPSLRTKMGEAGKRHFENNFSLKRMVDSHLDLYHRVLGR